MCVIASIPQGSSGISEESFYNCFNSNPDGFGMMWVDNGSIQIFKSLDLMLSLEKYEEVSKEFLDKSPIILHFRIGTQGPNDLTNCHPFVCSEKVAFCHNGIISQHSVPYQMKHTEKRSDTVLFNEEVLKKLPDDFIANANTRYLIADYIGTDKMAFLDVIEGYPCVSIINQSKGIVDEDTGIWYSNNSFKPYIRNFRVKKNTIKSEPKVYCEGCGSECKTKKETESGVCYKCNGKICECCGDVTTAHNRIEVKYGGKKHVLCNTCLDPKDAVFMGLFDNVNTLPEWVKVSEQVQYIMPTSQLYDDWYYIEKVDDFSIVVRRYSEIPARDNTRLTFSISRFLEYFESTTTV